VWIEGLNCFYRGQPRPHPHGGGLPCSHPNFGLLSIYAYTLCRRTTKFDVVTHMGRGLVVRGQPRSHSNWRSPILGFPSIYAYTLCHKTTKFDVVTRGVCRGQPRLPSQESGVPWLHSPQFVGFFCTVFMPTPFNTELPNSALWHIREGYVLGGWPRYCICLNASRGLSATAEFLVERTKSAVRLCAI